MIKYGIDVSEHQGDINWNSVKTDFVIIRAGYGREISQKDKKFECNYNEAKAAGIPCGAYWYSYAMSEDEARLEAHVCLSIIKNKQFEYPIYFDVEEQKTLVLGKENVSAIINAFCTELENAGYYVGLYMSASPLTTHTTDYIKKRYAVWVAHYGVSKPSYSNQYGMWQKASTGSILGINGNVDINECYIDYPKVIKTKGDNGFTKPVTEILKPASKTINAEIKVDGVTYSGTLIEKL